eukprot:CAMPEP_0172729686 /NCGR_PEP_ID=MMETSP1074-20121228/95611_1 /TAXON_ID=2916 /ORGANISM="Ceratium fusus, Strain PA161109" /LENGTH=40 /DNA_ID= /DNA_START= /DNA_END= /DNA_ORIENTATION=
MRVVVNRTMCTSSKGSRSSRKVALSIVADAAAVLAAAAAA